MPTNHTDPINQLRKTLLFAASCALLLLPCTAPSYAQAAEAVAQSANPVDFLFVSPEGSDDSSGLTPNATDGSGPFQTLAHAQKAVGLLTDAGLTRPVEVVLNPTLCPTEDFLGRWFEDAPKYPVIWHSEPSRTILIYTPTMADQIDALSAEDSATASAGSSGERVARFYVSPLGSDTWSGLLPGPDGSGKSDGPFHTLSQAQEAVNALRSESPNTPVEVVVEEDPATTAAFLSSTSVSALRKMAAGAPAKKPSKYTPAGLAALKAIAASKAASAKKPKTAIIIKPPVKTGTFANGTLAAGTAQTPRLVFAHYMVCNRDYGGSVAGYEREIQEAQAAGIDGFALNTGGWDGVYQNNVAGMFQAAEALNSGFKLFFSADMTGLSFQSVTAMMTAYANRPNYWHIQQTSPNGSVISRPFLSTWGGEGGGYTAAKEAWQNLTLSPLRAAGINPYFVPGFFLTSPDGQQYLAETPSSVNTEITGLLSGLADGMFSADSIGCPVDPSRTMLNAAETRASLIKAAGLTRISSVTTQYWGSRQTSAGRRYYEYDGGEGLQAQWESIINVQKPEWVEMFTWNDFDEATYASPIDDVSKYWNYLTVRSPGYYKCHAGALMLNQYYISWYKSGVKPAITSDSLYFFYRTQSKDAVATNDPEGPVTWRTGDVEDTLYITTMLTAPATLVVTTGSKTLTVSLTAGLSNTRVPFQVGAQSFSVVRRGTTILSQTGDPIVASPVQYNFAYYIGSAVAQPAK